MRYIRNLGRRKVRTALTILGVTIGIWALVVFGSMANKITALVEGGSGYYEDKLIVTDATGSQGGFSAVPMSMSVTNQLRHVGGITAVAPSVMLLMDEQPSTVSMGVPAMITGQVAGADEGLEKFIIKYVAGRGLTAEDEGTKVAVLGSDIARKYDKSVGDTMTLRGVDFEVVGIMEPTLTAPDQTAQVPMHEAQRLLIASLPAFVRDNLQDFDVTTSIAAYVRDGEDPEVVAERVRAQIANVSTMTGNDFDEQVGSATSILNSILVGIAMISLVVGGLSVINTMAMSIAERTREIGIKRAIGGSRFRIVRELVTESAIIGLVGGLIGLGLGFLVVIIGNELGRASGTVLFQLTVGTAITAVAFGTILGALAGFVPALHAARLDPVAALRYE